LPAPPRLAFLCALVPARFFSAAPRTALLRREGLTRTLCITYTHSLFHCAVEASVFTASAFALLYARISLLFHLLFLTATPACAYCASAYMCAALPLPHIWCSRRLASALSSFPRRTSFRTPPFLSPATTCHLHVYFTTLHYLARTHTCLCACSTTHTHCRHCTHCTTLLQHCHCSTMHFSLYTRHLCLLTHAYAAHYCLTYSLTLYSPPSTSCSTLLPLLPLHPACTYHTTSSCTPLTLLLLSPTTTHSHPPACPHTYLPHLHLSLACAYYSPTPLPAPHHLHCFPAPALPATTLPPPPAHHTFTAAHAGFRSRSLYCC